MKQIEQKVIDSYIPGKTSLRDVSRICGIDHHRVKRILDSAGIEILPSKMVFTKEHKENISKACKGRIGWSKGKKMTVECVRKNMVAHLRFDVSLEWLSQFDDIEKLKTLNNCITKRSSRFDNNSTWYVRYIEKFYHDDQFNRIYSKWIDSGKSLYFKPSVDHIVPVSKGGTNDIDNLQFLSWFENRCKNDMSQLEWDLIKENIKDYFV